MVGNHLEDLKGTLAEAISRLEAFKQPPEAISDLDSSICQVPFNAVYADNAKQAVPNSSRYSPHLTLKFKLGC